MRLGRTVARWSTLEHIGDIYVLATLHRERSEHVVEQAPRLPNEWLTLGVFFGARCLADEQPFGLNVANTRHALLACLAQPARRASGNNGRKTHPIERRDPGQSVYGRTRGVRCRIVHLFATDPHRRRW